MKYDIIKTENYLLIVDDSEIKVGDWMFNFLLNVISNITDRGAITVNLLAEIKRFKTRFKKIIAHRPLNGSPILEGVGLLPPLEDEVDELAEEWNDKGEFTSPYSFKAGYNKAKEKYKYTENDMRKAFRSGAFTGAYTGNNSGVHIEKDENNFIQSFQQPKYPIAFECEIEKPSDSFGSWVGTFINGSTKTKTTTNSNGQTEWVGQYIY